VKKVFPSCHALIYTMSGRDVSENLKSIDERLERDTDFANDYGTDAVERPGAYVTVPFEAYEGGQRLFNYMRGLVVTKGDKADAIVYLLDLGDLVEAEKALLRPMPQALVEKAPLLRFVRIQGISAEMNDSGADDLPTSAAKLLTQLVNEDSLFMVQSSARFKLVLKHMFASHNVHTKLASIRSVVYLIWEGVFFIFFIFQTSLRGEQVPPPRRVPIE
jgi:hypothetical protein